MEIDTTTIIQGLYPSWNPLKAAASVGSCRWGYHNWANSLPTCSPPAAAAEAVLLPLQHSRWPVTGAETGCPGPANWSSRLLGHNCQMISPSRQQCPLAGCQNLQSIPSSCQLFQLTWKTRLFQQLFQQLFLTLFCPRCHSPRNSCHMVCSDL